MDQTGAENHCLHRRSDLTLDTALAGPGFTRKAPRFSQEEEQNRSQNEQVA